MYQTALLLLTGPIRSVAESIGQYLNKANKRVVKRLYVKLEPEFSNPYSKQDSERRSQLYSIIPTVYSKASSVCKHLDVRVLLTNLRSSKTKICPTLNFDVILTNSNEEDKLISNYVDSYFNNNTCNIVKLDDISLPSAKYESEELELIEIYKTVCLGGTFDRLHNGHKVLLSEAALRTEEKLIIGVSDYQMLRKKVLWELIEPVEKRINEVCQFIVDIDPSISHDVVPISDPFGPTITNPEMDCIVVTTETQTGGEKVNIERRKRGMTELKMVVVNLVENSDRCSHEDEKISSSTIRMNLLGIPLNSSQISASDRTPYCILLRGHFISGKSFISTRFQLLGLPVLCCDEILKALLSKNENLRKAVSEKVFKDYGPAQSIDFEKLTLCCLKNKEDRDWLAELMQDKIRSSLHQVLKVYAEQGTPVVLIKDSTILEGLDLDFEINEIWATILPTSEALKKLKEFYNMPDDEACKIIDLLPTNQQYVKSANILFCNLWSTEAIQTQVEKAWSYVISIKNSMLPNML